MGSRCSRSLAALWLLLASTALWAQPAPEPPVPAPVASAPSATQSTAEATAAAVAQQGIDLFKQGRYTEALPLFQRAFQMAPVAVVAWNLARCHEELEQPDEAIASFRQFRDLSPEEDMKQVAATKIDRLLQRYFGSLALVTEPAGAEASLDGKPLGKTPLKLQVRTGEHNLMLSLAGYESQLRSLQVAPGQAFSFTFTLVPAPAMVVVDAPEPVGGLVILVDGVRQPQVAAPARFQVTPGAHVVEVQAGPDWVPLRQTVAAGAGEEATLRLVRSAGASPDGPGPLAAPVVVIKKAPTVRVIDAGGGRSYTTVASVILGVGLAAAGAGGVLHVIGYARWKDVTGAKTDPISHHVTGITRAEAAGIADSARLKYVVAYGLYGVGAAALTTSIVLYALGGSEPASTSLAPLPLPDGAGLSLSGRF